MPEWFSNGLTERERRTSGAEWDKRDRTINGGSNVAAALAAEILGLRRAWNDEAFFVFIEDRYWPQEGVRTSRKNRIHHFTVAMWGASNFCPQVTGAEGASLLKIAPWVSKVSFQQTLVR